jgi:succinyl-CoA synthetase beta subunit
LKDDRQENPDELEAEKYDLHYIGLDGSIGCLVNGAGLAMATMDIIKLYGGQPANFLDCGGAADVNQIMEGFRILENNTDVKAVLVNIFGGILRCDAIAKAIVQANEQFGITKPIVCRLKGTNSERVFEILESANIQIDYTEDLENAAEKVVALSQS